MASIEGVITKVHDGGVLDVWLATWAGVGNADQGTAVPMSMSSDRSVQIEGTFGGATVLIEGSNDGVFWRTLTDPQGNPISKTSPSIEQISEITRYVRPSTTGGAGTNLTVSLIMKGQR